MATNSERSLARPVDKTNMSARHATNIRTNAVISNRSFCNREGLLSSQIEHKEDNRQSEIMEDEPCYEPGTRYRSSTLTGYPISQREQNALGIRVEPRTPTVPKYKQQPIAPVNVPVLSFAEVLRESARQKLRLELDTNTPIKTVLNNIAQDLKQPKPVYIDHATGESHSLHFFATCDFLGQTARGTGTTKTQAHNAAASTWADLYLNAKREIPASIRITPKPIRPNYPNSNMYTWYNQIPPGYVDELINTSGFPAIAQSIQTQISFSRSVYPTGDDSFFLFYICSAGAANITETWLDWDSTTYQPIMLCSHVTDANPLSVTNPMITNSSCQVTVTVNLNGPFDIHVAYYCTDVVAQGAQFSWTAICSNNSSASNHKGDGPSEDVVYFEFLSILKATDFPEFNRYVILELLDEQPTIPTGWEDVEASTDKLEEEDHEAREKRETLDKLIKDKKDKKEKTELKKLDKAAGSNEKDKKGLTDIQQAVKLPNVLRRLANVIKTPIQFAKWYIMRKPTKDFAMLLWMKIMDFPPSEENRVATDYITARFHGVEKSIEFLNYVMHTSKLQKWFRSESYQVFLDYMFPEELFEDPPVYPLKSDLLDSMAPGVGELKAKIPFVPMPPSNFDFEPSTSPEIIDLFGDIEDGFDKSIQAKKNNTQEAENGHDMTCQQNTSSLEMSARSHNQAMHAGNGNTSTDPNNNNADPNALVLPAVVPRTSTSLVQADTATYDPAFSWADEEYATTMEEIERKRGIRSYPKDAPMRRGMVDPVAILSFFSGMGGPFGAAANVASFQDVHTASFYAANNTVTTGQMDPPELQLFPRGYRFQPGAIAQSTVSTSWFHVGAIVKQARPVAPTAISLGGNELLRSGRGLRANAISDGGFRVEDITALSFGGSGISGPGDSMIVPFLRMALYMMALAWDANTAQLPLGNVNKLDYFTNSTNPPQLIAFGYNSTLINFNESCGGATSVFPWGLDFVPNPSGSISFHQDLSSMNNDQRTSFYTAPASVLSRPEVTPGVNFAMLAMMFAPGPCGIFNVTLNTTDSNGNNEDNLTYIPCSNLVRTDGESQLRILIPRIESGILPFNQATANAGLVAQPSVGPTASTVFVAPGQVLNVSYSNNAGPVITQYNLAQYLYTWLAQPNSPIDQTSILVFMTAYANATNRWADLWAAFEIAAVFNNRYVPMFYGPVGSVPLPLGEQWQLYDTVLATGTRPQFAGSIAGLAFPLNPLNGYHIILPGYGPLWIAQQIMEVMTTAPIGRNTSQITWITTPQIVQYSRYIARQYAATYTVFYKQAGLMVATWNTIFANNVMSKVRDVYTKIWISTGRQAGPVTSPLGSNLACLHAALCPNSPTVDSFGNSFYSYVSTPPSDAGTNGPYPGVYPPAQLASLTGVIPTLVADIWLYRTCVDLPKCLQPLPLPFVRTRGLIANGQQMLLFRGAIPTVRVIAGNRMAYVMSPYGVPVPDDVEIFDQRLIIASTLSTVVYDTAGAVIAFNIPGATSQVCQRPITADFSVPSLVVQRGVTATTLWAAMIDNVGTNVIVGSLAGNSIIVAQLLAGALSMQFEGWSWPGRVSAPSVPTGGIANEPDWLMDPSAK